MKISTIAITKMFMIFISMFIIFTFIFHTTSSINQCKTEEFTDLISSLGYPVSIHKVYTKDGYILTLFRIQGKGSEIVKNKPTILLQHGLTGCADDWVINDEKRSLGLILANNGFDVWIGNNRGTKYSLKHQTLDNGSKEFWDFSFQEMGMYDVPANIDFILKATGNEKLIYVGHSQGTTQMYAALSDPITSAYVNKRIKLFVCLAPAVFMAKNQFPFYKFAFKIRKILKATSEVLKLYSFGNHVCSQGTIAKVAKNSLYYVMPLSCPAFFRENDDNNRRALFYKHYPSGASLRCILHYLQTMEEGSGPFEKYDFGISGNMKHYGKKKPPLYDLSRINVPIRSFVGLEDLMTGYEDSLNLEKTMLGFGLDFVQFVYKRVSHFTFIWGRDTHGMLGDVLREINKYT